MNTHINAREAAGVPVEYDVDVIVAGSGVSGAFAALGAAGQGAKVVLVDRFGEPGGNLGPGIIIGGIWGDDQWQFKWEVNNAFMLSPPGMVTQFFERLERSLDDMPRNYGTLSNGMSRVFFEMFSEAGVELILSAYVADPILVNGRTRGLYVETKSGRIAVQSKVVVDATGDADIARRAGVPFRKGSTVQECDVPNVQKPFRDQRYETWNEGQIYFFLADVDLETYNTFRKRECCLSDEQVQWAETHLKDPPALYSINWDDAMVPILKDAWESGEFEAVRWLKHHVQVRLDNWFEPVDTRIVGGRARVQGDYDTGDFRDVSLTEAAVRCMAFDGVKFLRKHVPGFEKAYMLSSSAFLGGRGGPFIEASHILTPAESIAGFRAPDTLFLSGTEEYAETDKRGFDMPYRMLLPAEIEGLLVTGRGAAFHRRGHDPATRGRGNMMGLGLAAGIAAALSAKINITPGKLNVRKLQKTLLAEGFFIGDDSRLASLGL
jgi:hypothetical protein